MDKLIPVMLTAAQIDMLITACKHSRRFLDGSIKATENAIEKDATNREFCDHFGIDFYAMYGFTEESHAAHIEYLNGMIADETDKLNAYEDLSEILAAVKPRTTRERLETIRAAEERNNARIGGGK